MSTGRGIGKATSAHFVLSGTISMVQRLMIIRNPSDGSIKLHAANAPPSSDAEPIFMQVCLFNQGGSFNVGQSFKYKFIVFSEIMFKVVQDLELSERLPYETQNEFLSLRK